MLVGGVVGGAVARDRAAQPQVVCHREPREHATALGRQRDPAAHDRLRRELVDRRALERHLPTGDRHEAHHRLEQARLARAVGAQQGDDLALLDVQRHVLHGHDGPVADDEVVDGEDVHARRLQAHALAMYFGVKLVRNVNFFPFILTRKTSLTGTWPTGSIVRSPVASL